MDPHAALASRLVRVGLRRSGSARPPPRLEYLAGKGTISRAGRLTTRTGNAPSPPAPAFPSGSPATSMAGFFRSGTASRSGPVRLPGTMESAQMSSHMPPIPPANRSPKGPKDETNPHQDAAAEHSGTAKYRGTGGNGEHQAEHDQQGVFPRPPGQVTSSVRAHSRRACAIQGPPTGRVSTEIAAAGVNPRTSGSKRQRGHNH